MPGKENEALNPPVLWKIRMGLIEETRQKNVKEEKAQLKGRGKQSIGESEKA